MDAAAFFDLDRTLLSRSSSLVLARPLREAGVIRRRDLVKAALWQLRFVVRGASAEEVEHAADRGMRVLEGMRVDELQRIVDESLEPLLRPLVYPRALELVGEHRARGERVYIVSAALQEIVDALAAHLGLDGGIGSICESRDGVYTGRPARSAHGEEKAAALRELAGAEGIDLERSTAYSDSHTDLPFLEAVGSAVAVNPDRELRRVADERGWPVLAFSRRAA